LESYSVTIGRKLVAWGQKKSMVLKTKHIQGCVPACLHQFSQNCSQRFEKMKKKHPESQLGLVKLCKTQMQAHTHTKNFQAILKSTLIKKNGN
jgi:hypothetical protein